MPDFDRQIHDWQKGKFRYFGCLECGKKTLLGNLAQRVREGMPLCHGKNMLLVKADADHDHVHAALKLKRGEKLQPEEIRALEAFVNGAEVKRDG